MQTVILDTDFKKLIDYSVAHQAMNVHHPLQVEIIDEITKVTLYLTTTYHNSSITHRFAACCGNKLYVNNVESEIYRYLF